MRAVLCLATALALAGCQRADTGATAAERSDSVGDIEGIRWFEGDLDAAFAAAAAGDKPVFLYWGAEWCPPCHDLKAHVFSRRDFQQKLQQFVPVYLDGDAPGAQRSGEEFQVLGYPTAVVLTADRAEISRISGGQDLASYADMLDLALDDVRPLPEVLAALRSNATGTVTDADCRRLAYNGWSLDPRVEEGELVTSLVFAAQRCPAEAVNERDRLAVVATDFAARAERKAVEAGSAVSPQLAGLLDNVEALLAERDRGLAAGDALLSLGEDFFVIERLARPAGVARLRAHWYALMDAVETDPRFSGSTQLLTAATRLQAAKALDADGKIPGEVAARSRATLDAFLARSYDADARSGIVNSASWVLTFLDDDDRLRALLEEQIRTSKTPYYYLPDLADLEEKAGNQPQALDLLERGYREARGPATRFQWGVIYVDGLLRMSPGDEPRIRAAVLEVIGELDGPDRIHARARSRLERLRSSLGRWAGETDNAATLTAIGQRWGQICDALPESDPVRTECPGLLRGS